MIRQHSENTLDSKWNYSSSYFEPPLITVHFIAICDGRTTRQSGMELPQVELVMGVPEYRLSKLRNNSFKCDTRFRQ